MRYSIFISLFFLFFSSCSDNSKNDLEVFRTLNNGLIQSTKTISSSSMQVYKAFESRVLDFNYNNEKIKFWQSRAIRVKLISDSIRLYFNELKTELGKVTGLNSKVDTELQNDENVTDVSHFFSKKSKGLFDKLINYRQHILSVDTSLKNEFQYNLTVFPKRFDYKKSSSKEFEETYFGKIPAIAAMCLLNNFENIVSINENDFIHFCLYQTPDSFCGFSNNPSPFISQSSNYVKGGENIEITAGVGSFSTIAKPTMKINNKTVNHNAEGILLKN